MQVKIRPLEERDARVSVGWRNDPDIWKFTASRPDRTITLQDETDWIRRVMADETSRRFAVLADDTYVGNIYLTDITKNDAEYHIFIGDKNFWGKGIAGEASRLIIDYANDELGLDKIHLKVREDNEAAHHLYKKLGFIDKVLDEEGFWTMQLDIRRKNSEER